jgi:hypothetical protein
MIGIRFDEVKKNGIIAVSAELIRTTCRAVGQKRSEKILLKRRLLRFPELV